MEKDGKRSVQQTRAKYGKKSDWTKDDNHHRYKQNCNYQMSYLGIDSVENSPHRSQGSHYLLES